MIKLSELQLKEVIIIENGKRLGHIYDLVIDPDKGRITAIVIIEREGKNGFFGKADEMIIDWRQITTIGQDVILVKESFSQHLLLEPNRID